MKFIKYLKKSWVYFWTVPSKKQGRKAEAAKWEDRYKEQMAKLEQGKKND